MLRVALLLLILSLTGCAVREVSDAEKARLHLEIGTGHLANGKYPQALNELLTAVKLDPKNPEAQNHLGIAYFVRGKFSEAKSAFQEALAWKPDYTEARNNLGRTLLELDMNSQAVIVLRIAVEDLTYSAPEKSQSNLGIAYFRTGSYEQALKHLKESLRLRSGHCLTANYFARSLFELKKYNQASIAFDQAANNCKEDKLDEPIYYGALTYFKLNKVEEAKARFQEVLSSFPDGSYSEQAKNMLRIIEKN